MDYFIMKYSKEILYHFSCEICYNWWTYPAGMHETDFNTKIWFCPHCLHEHRPPHKNVFLQSDK